MMKTEHYGAQSLFVIYLVTLSLPQDHRAMESNGRINIKWTGKEDEEVIMA
jgi:hypothetical protein